MNKILKHMLILGIISITNAAVVHAANGDMIQPIYSTDILTYMDNIPIQGYAIDGKMMICLENLEDYGFNVYYNDEARVLFVNKQGKADASFRPVILRGKVGDISGYTYETDIRAYLNGQEIDAENIGGRLAVAAEDISDIENSGSISYLGFKDFSKYFMSHIYDDSSRTLNLYSDIYQPGMYETNLEKYQYCIRNMRKSAKTIDSFIGKDYTSYIVRGGDINGLDETGCNAVRFYKSGRILNAEAAIKAYSFITRYGSAAEDAKFSEDGKYLVFTGKRSKAQPHSLMGSRDVFEEGEYKLDMDTFELMKINTHAYRLPIYEENADFIWP